MCNNIYVFLNIYISKKKVHLNNVIQEMGGAHPVQCPWLGRSHDHAQELLTCPLVYRVNSSGCEASVTFHKLAQLLIDLGILVSQEDPSDPQLSLDVDEADLPGFPAFLSILVDVRRPRRRRQDERLHVALLLVYLPLRAEGGQSYLGVFTDGRRLVSRRRAVRQLIADSDGYIQEETFVWVVLLAGLVELSAVLSEVVLEAVQLAEGQVCRGHLKTVQPELQEITG